MTKNDALVAKLTDVIAEVQTALGIENTRKLLAALAAGLGAPATIKDTHDDR